MDSCGAERGYHPEYSLATFGYKTGYESNKKITSHFWLQAIEPNREIFSYIFQMKKFFGLPEN
jgi:hypothetical protein